MEDAMLQVGCNVQCSLQYTVICEGRRLHELMWQQIIKFRLHVKMDDSYQGAPSVFYRYLETIDFCPDNV